MMRNRRAYMESFIGKMVQVVVDRPVGYDHDGMVYPVNYGYIPGTLAGDNEPQDVYILGIEKPLIEFVGQVIGAILRMNDVEDKLIVAPKGIEFHQAQIREMVHFQEQYFDTIVISSFEKSCGVLPYRMTNGEPEFLLVFESASKCWSLPKGHMESGEKEDETALRELFEETGLAARLDMDKHAAIEYPISPFARKQVQFFLGEVTGNPRVRPGEIEKFQWVKKEDLQNYLFPDTFRACEKILP